MRKDHKLGGNAIENVTRINQENVLATLEDVYRILLPCLNLNRSDVRVFGSTGKKNFGESSSDIDLGILKHSLVDKNCLSDHSIGDFVKLSVNQITKQVKYIKGAGLVSLSWPINNVDGKQYGQDVQLDLLLVDDLNYSEWAYYSPHSSESEWKGLYRNELLMAVASVGDRKVLKKINNSDVEWERSYFDFKGFYKGVQSRVGKTGRILKTKKTIRKWLVSRDPDEVVTILLSSKYHSKDILTFESTFDVIMSNDFRYKNKRDEILQKAKLGILGKGYPIPEVLEESLNV